MPFETVATYHLPDGWNIDLPIDWMCTVDESVNPTQHIFRWDNTDSLVYCSVWRFTCDDAGSPASVAQMHEVFCLAAIDQDLTPAEEVSQFYPPGFAVAAYQGYTRNGIPMLVFVLCTPGHMMTAYLVGEDEMMRDILCACMSCVTHTVNAPSPPGVPNTMADRPRNKIERDTKPWRPNKP